MSRGKEKSISYSELMEELGVASSDIHALAARVTQLRDRLKPVVKPPPKSWLQMETELIGLRGRVAATLYNEEHWSYRRIAALLAITPENVRRHVERQGRGRRRARLIVEWKARAVGMTNEQRSELLAQSPRILRVGTWTGSKLEQFRTLRVLCDFTALELTGKIGVKRVREVRDALAEHGLSLKEDNFIRDMTDEDGSPLDADNDPDA